MSERTLCTFVVADSHYGVDVTLVQEVFHGQRVTRVPLAPPTVGGLINLRGQIVTAFDVRICSGLPPGKKDGTRVGLVVRAEERLVCLLVDELGDVITVDDEACEAIPETVAGERRHLLCGAYKLADQLVLSLDINAAIRAAEGGDIRS